jgi:hypothetical protein
MGGRSPAVAGLLTCVLILGACGQSGGPVGNPERNRLGLSVKAGKPFTYGVAIAYNHGPEPAILENVELHRPTPGFKLLEQEIAGPHRGVGYLASARTYPARRPRLRDLHPVPGYVMPPAGERAGERGAEIVLALQTPGPGTYRFQGLRLTYRVGTQRYTTVIPHALRACGVTHHKKGSWPRCLANRTYS